MEVTLCACRLLLSICLLLQGYHALPSQLSTLDNSYGSTASSSGELSELHEHQTSTKYEKAPQESARIFFNIVGDLISSVPFLPIEINIPDTISQVTEYIGSWFTGNSQGEESQQEPLQRLLIDGFMSLFSKENSK